MVHVDGCMRGCARMYALQTYAKGSSASPYWAQLPDTPQLPLREEEDVHLAHTAEGKPLRALCVGPALPRFAS